MTNGEKIKAILKPRTDEIRIYGDWVEIEIQRLGINFSCGLDWWNSEYKEPTTKNDLVIDCISRADLVIDYISRANVLKLMKDNWHTHNGDWAMQESMDDIRALPSVTPQEHKVGRWIFAEGIKGKDNVEKCSCCGSHWKEAIIYQTDTQEYLRTRLLYCPNCGSRNEVEE